MRGQNKEQHPEAIFMIGIDLLGSDTPPEQLLKKLLEQVPLLSPAVSLTLLGTHVLFEGKVSPSSQVLFYPVTDAITMDEAPLEAIRKKKGASLCMGIELLKERKIQAFISGGNTGALMGCAKLKLSPLPMVNRPALLTLFPIKQNKDVAIIDVGANTHCLSKHLLEFAVMGAAYQRSCGIERPRLGLLNIGTEEKKGSLELQATYAGLKTLEQKSPSLFQFFGNIEARDVFEGQIDVLVTDGFTGNVFLKTCEGIARTLLQQVEQELMIPTCSDLKTVFQTMRSYLHYAEYPGALFCGIEGIVMKCHGDLSCNSLMRTIEIAQHLIENKFIERIKETLCLELIS